MFRAFTLFKIRDIPVRVDPTWLIAFALFTYLIYTSYRNLYPDWTLGLQLGLAMLSVLLLFTLVLIHEFAHSIVAQIRGYKVHSITLFMLGGVSNIHSEATKARDEFIIAVVGPLTNVIFFFIFWLILAVVPINNEPLFVFLNYARGANLVLAIFNMLPGIPLDGGRVLKSLIWGVSPQPVPGIELVGDRRAGDGWIDDGVRSAGTVFTAVYRSVGSNWDERGYRVPAGYIERSWHIWHGRDLAGANRVLYV